MKLMMIFADGFEDTEAIGTLDVLMRGNIKVDLVSLMGRNKVLMKSGIEINIPLLYENINMNDYDGIIIPGGPASFKIMPNMKSVSDLIDYFVENNKLVASICAAPHLVGKKGYFKDKKFTVHPGFENEVIGGEYLRDEGVVVDSNFITAKSMFFSIDFGLAIYEYFYGHEKMLSLKHACMGEK